MVRTGTEFKLRLLTLGCSEEYAESARLGYVAKEAARVDYLRKSYQEEHIHYDPKA